MSDEEPSVPVLTTAIEQTKEAGSLVVKDTTEPMTVQEFGEWFEALGTTGWRVALQQAAFMLCCDVIAQDVAKSTLRLKRRTSPKTAEIVMPRQHPMAELLANEPNRWHTWYEYNEMEALWACISQNAFAGIIRTMTGDIVELLPFRSDGQVFEKVADGKIYYEVHASTLADQARLGGMSRVFREEDFIHVRGRLLDGFDGYSTLIAGREVLNTAKAIGKFRQQLFNEEGQYRGVFTRENTEALPQEIFDRVRQQYKTLMNKFRELKEPVVLEGGLKFEAISNNPKELELATQFEAQINEMCRLLRVPPHKVFQLNGAKYENLETQEKMYVGDTLVPFCERFEQRYGKQLLSREDRLDFFFEFDREEMTLRDPKNETDRVIRAAERGIIEIDEARAVLGFNALPKGQGQVRLIPVNMNVVDRDGDVVVGGQAGKDAPPASDTTNGDTATPAKAVELRVVASN